jgi:APA family basic amino acid/polyamine antiporter
MAQLSEVAKEEEKHELRREVTVWGSYMWGFADVGADTYVAMGLVFAAAQGAAGLAFALAGLVYIMIGLAYTELASAYPVAGGGQYFALRGLGDFWGFVAGSALVLDYTIDIALFSAASAGYVNFFMPYLFGVNIDSLVVNIGPLHNVHYFWCIETIAIVGILIWLNIRGMRESSLVNEIVGVIIILTESALVILGFLFAWKPELLVHQWKMEFPSLHDFMYGSSLAIISFVGLESISQAAQETKRPATIVPRTSITLIFTVFIFAVSFSVLGLGMLPWQEFKEHMDNPVAILAKSMPYVGVIAGPFAAFLGAIMLFISANSGVMSVSRLTYSMSELGITSKWFDQVHPKYHTPVRAIMIFSLIGMIQVILSFLTPNAMVTLGNMYAFGATVGYIIVFIALIRLRFSDPYTPRAYKVPLNLRLKFKHKEVEFPILGLIGMAGVGMILFMVVWTHEIGRIAGPGWILLCFAYYAWFRKSQKMPVFGSLKRNWEKQQIEVLTSAEEYDLLEQYKLALADRDEELKKSKVIENAST